MFSIKNVFENFAKVAIKLIRSLSFQNIYMLFYFVACKQIRCPANSGSRCRLLASNGKKYTYCQFRKARCFNQGLRKIKFICW